MLLWTGQTLSDLGSYTSQLAVPLLVLAITGSPAKAGLVGTGAAVVSAVVRLPGGALADRWNRRRLMLASDAVRLVAAATLGVAVAVGWVSFPLVLAVVGVSAIFDVLFSPAEMAAVRRLVPTSEVTAAFARNEARSYAASLGGPPLGGLLYGLGRAVPFLADAFSYLVSMIAVGAIRTPMQDERPDRAPQKLLADIREGVLHVARSPFLRALLLTAAPLNVAVTGALFAVTIVLRQAGTAAGVIGLAQGVVSVGGLAGAFAAAWIQRRLPFRRLIVTGELGLLLAVGGATALTGHLAMVAPLAVGLFLAPAVNASLFGRLAATTPDHIQARVMSVVMLAATGAAALAPLAVGLIIGRVSGTAAMAACTVAVGVSALVAALARGLRDDEPAAG